MDAYLQRLIEYAEETGMDDDDETTLAMNFAEEDLMTLKYSLRMNRGLFRHLSFCTKAEMTSLTGMEVSDEFVDAMKNFN